MATEVNYPEIFGLTIGSNPSLLDYAKYFFNIGIAIASIVAVIYVAITGIEYIISFASGKAKANATEKIKYGLLGLLIILSSYAIASTINPALTVFHLDDLPGVKFIWRAGNDLAHNGNVRTFNQIPVGTTIEKALTDTMDCYDFDFNGNPIWGSREESDDGQEADMPTYFKHDKEDCMLKLVDAAKKRADIANKLSQEIKKMMESCKCSEDKCSNDFTGSKSGPLGEKDRCDCMDDAGKASSQESNCWVKGGDRSGANEVSNECCDKEVSDKFEHGSVKISACEGADEIEYKGLDEFRCQNNDCSVPELEKTVKIKGADVTVIQKDKWQKMNLIQQINYYKEKISKIQQEIKNQQQKMQQAASMVNNCYMPTSYFELFNKKQKTDPSKYVVMVSDPLGQKVERYCTGFNYAESSCYKRCQDECPDYSSQDSSFLNCIASAAQCPKDDPSCEKKLKDYIFNACFLKKPCAYAPSQADYKDFEGCINSCKNTCASICQQKASPCSKDLTYCLNRCQNDSTCLLNPKNASNCLYDAIGLQNCAKNSQGTDPWNIQKCIDRSYFCKYGSKQNAGYPDCLDKAYQKESYSSSNIYIEDILNGRDIEKAKNPYALAKSGRYIDFYPETAKCPSASQCSDCPCDKLVATKDQIGVDINQYRMVGPECGGYAYNDDPLTFYCEQSWWYAPDLQKNNVPLGGAMRCPLTRQIPVGQTVDAANKWVNSLIAQTQQAQQPISELYQLMFQIGNYQSSGQHYCSCDSVSSGKPTCKATCSYTPPTTEQALEKSTDADGKPIQILVTKKVPAKCSTTPCAGDSCKALMDLLEKVQNSYDNISSASSGFYSFKIKEGRSEVLKMLDYSRQKANECYTISNTSGQGSQMINCQRVEHELLPPINNESIAVDVNGIKNEKRHCYGKNLGNSLGQNLTEDWYCCEIYSASK